jgi:tetratricopeptide (TPR) repeat protein
MLRESLKMFPDDLDIRLAVGSVYETLGWKGVEETLGKAEKLYRGVIEADPLSVEAHLRLGRVLQLQNRGREAVQELRWSLERTDDPQLLLVAHIILGEIFHQRGEDDEAIRSYRAALEVDPRCSVAAVALSQTFHRAGDSKSSREVIVDFLTAPGRSGGGPDLWWRYMRGCKERATSALSEMREELVR